MEDPPEPTERDDRAEEIARAFANADTLSDLGFEIPRELLEAARAELAMPGDETDEG
jgi:hypothetical protein